MCIAKGRVRARELERQEDGSRTKTFLIRSNLSWDREGSGRLSRFPLLLKRVYVFAKQHTRNIFSVQIHLVLQRQPRILKKKEKKIPTTFVCRSSEINTVLHQSKVKPSFVSNKRVKVHQLTTWSTVGRGGAVGWLKQAWGSCIMGGTLSLSLSLLMKSFSSLCLIKQKATQSASERKC